MASTDIAVIAALHPLKVERTEKVVQPGNTITEIFEILGTDPILIGAAHVYINDVYIYRKQWSHVRPKPGTIVTVRAFIAPGDGNSDLLRNILLIAVAATALILPPLLGLTGILAAGAQALVGIGGMLAVNALIPPSSPGATGPTAPTPVDVVETPTRFIEGTRNRANQWGPVPLVLGQMKVIPNYSAQPVTRVVGDDQYLYLRFLWSLGAIEFDTTSFKIGETLLSDYDDVATEHRAGFITDTPITLYTKVQSEEDFSLPMLFADGFFTRTTDEAIDIIGVDIVFPNGLITFADDGTRSPASCAFQIQYSVVGAGVWTDITWANSIRTFPQSWTNSSGGTFSIVNVTHQQTAAVRHSVHWSVPNGQYDVRVKRVSADAVSDNIRDAIVWTALRSIRNVETVNSPVKVAESALRIRATGQLNNVIDEFSAIIQTVCLDWNAGTTTWIVQATRNPASLFRYVLQCGLLQAPYADAKIDLTTLQTWHAYCVTKDFEFNQYRDWKSSLWDVLSDIARAGRASPTIIDGKWSVIIDQPKTPVSHVTPRNSRNFSAEKLFITQPPHCIRVQYINEDKDYRQDELRVYMTGYNAGNATIFETAEYPGITNKAQLGKAVLFDMAVAIQRPERWTWQQDMERLVYRRGDVVVVTHDVLLIGLATGRIKSLTVNGSGDILTITVDEILTMEAFKTYGVSIRTDVNATVTGQLITVAGDNAIVTFVTPIDAAEGVVVGNLFGFGLIGQETDQALILSVSPKQNYDAEVVAVPYRENVYNADASALEPFETNLTPIPSVPDVIVSNVRSDESVLTVGPGESLSVHVNVKVVGVKTMQCRLQAEVRPRSDTERWVAAQVDSYLDNEISIGNVRTNEYIDIRLRWLAQGRQPGRWTTISGHRVIGKSTAPAPLSGLTISVFGGSAYMRWSKPKELDVQFGGEVRFRHSAAALPSWSNSNSIGEVAQARSLLSVLPLKPGTYLARVYDQTGTPSTVVSVSTLQASVLTYGPVNSLSEHPTFPGSHTNTIFDGQYLKLVGAGNWDSIPDFDAEETIDYYGGGVISTGTYQFALGFDFGSVKKVRLTVSLQMFNANVFDNIDSWVGTIDNREDFDGAASSECDIKIYVSITSDDPNSGGAVWGNYERLDSAEIQARGCRFRAILTSENPDFDIFINLLTVTAEEVI